MTKTIMYTYLGTNGTFSSPVHLEGVYCVKKVLLIADGGKSLTKNHKDYFTTVTIPYEDLELWEEVTLDK